MNDSLEKSLKVLTHELRVCQDDKCGMDFAVILFFSLLFLLLFLKSRILKGIKKLMEKNLFWLMVSEISVYDHSVPLMGHIGRQKIMMENCKRNYKNVTRLVTQNHVEVKKPL